MKKTLFILLALFMLTLGCFAQKTLCKATTIDGTEYSILDVGSSSTDIVMMQTYYEWESDKWNNYVTFKDLNRTIKLFEEALIKRQTDNYRDFDNNIYSFKMTNLESFTSSNFVEALLFNNGSYISIKFTAYDRYGCTVADLRSATFTKEEYRKIIEALKR